MSTIGGMQLFTEPLIFGQGATHLRRQSAAVPDRVDVHVREGFRDFDYGYGSAIAWMIFLLIVAARAWSTS